MRILLKIINKILWIQKKYLYLQANTAKIPSKSGVTGFDSV